MDLNKVMRCLTFLIPIGCDAFEKIIPTSNNQKIYNKQIDFKYQSFLSFTLKYSLGILTCIVENDRFHHRV